MDQQALQSWPWGGQGDVPKDQQRGVFCLPEPASSCANSFCQAHLGFPGPFILQFVLASPQSQALHHFQPVPLAPLASQASRLRLQGLRLSQGLGLNQNQTEKRKEAQLLSGLLSDFYWPQTDEPHSPSWPDMNRTPPLSLAFIPPCFL